MIFAPRLHFWWTRTYRISGEVWCSDGNYRDFLPNLPRGRKVDSNLIRPLILRRRFDSPNRRGAWPFFRGTIIALLCYSYHPVGQFTVLYQAPAGIGKIMPGIARHQAPRFRVFFLVGRQYNARLSSVIPPIPGENQASRKNGHAPVEPFRASTFFCRGVELMLQRRSERRNGRHSQ